MAKKQFIPTFIKEERKPAPTNHYDAPIPITSNHKLMHNILKDWSKKVVLITGFAGTGKSICSCYYAAQALKEDKVNGIIIIRSLCGIGKDPGALPGDVLAKNLPKVSQFLKYISAFTGIDTTTLIQNDMVTIEGLHDIQGQDWSNKYVIVTESQTLGPSEMYILVSRGAEKIVFDGDTLNRGQASNKAVKYGRDGLSFLLDVLKGLPFVASVKLSNIDDIVRKDYIRDIILRITPKLDEWLDSK